MNEQTTQLESGDEQVDPIIHQHFEKAHALMLESVRTAASLELAPPSVASALGATYVQFVAAMCYAAGVPREQVLEKCADALSTLDEFVGEVYKKMDGFVAARKAEE